VVLIVPQEFTCRKVSVEGGLKLNVCMTPPAVIIIALHVATYQTQGWNIFSTFLYSVYV
jgi:hypothetical protein